MKREATLKSNYAGDVGRGKTHRSLDQFRIKVKQHWLTARFNGSSLFATTIGEVDDHTRSAALIERDADVAKVELDEIGKSSEANVVGMRLQGRELGALRNRKVQRVEFSAENAETKVEVVDNQSNCVVRQVIRVDLSVVVKVFGGAIQPDKSVHIIGTDIDGVDLDI